MENSYRKTGTTKGNRHKIVTPNIEAAWAAYFKASEADDLEALRKEGWKTADELSEMTGVPLHITRQRAVGDQRLEKKSIRTFFKGVTRTINIYRPRNAVDPAARKV